MAFIPVTTSEVEVGKPTTSTLMDKVKDNLDDHEARLQSVETGGAVTYPPIILRVGGFYPRKGAATGMVKTVTNFDLTVTGIRLYIDRAGTAGTTTIDAKVSTAGSAYGTILTTLPSVASSAGNDAVSSNGVLDATKVVVPSGSIIRIDQTTVQTDGISYWVRIDYVKN